jgi:puromycin-sensitive aminopeptidase
MPTSNARILPGNVRPVAYELTLEPDFDSFTFTGEESVEIEVLEPTSSITLNCVEIDVKSVSVKLNGGASLPSSSIDYNEEDESATFRFVSTIPAGGAKLDIEFVGELNDKLRGFYRSRYNDLDGNEQVMASTQFEATDARRAFPCWDEPSLKATFHLTLNIPSSLVAVSNMPIASETEIRPGVTAVSYEKSPIMSTYLLAFAVGDFTSIEQVADGGAQMRIWTTRGREEQGRFALETSVRLLEYFNKYFGIAYPLPKLDHIAIPDFAAGAMENWGAITYRETALLVDPENSSAGTRQTVASIIAHEMAHMWFGDLVTMAWWNDLWLNESFASWMGDKATDNLFPEWEVWTQFVTGDTNRGLSLDGLKNSHPIEQEVNNPDQISELFDAISYSKGAAVLRMLETFLGEEPFRQGLHNYLTEHSYANAEGQDLWNALGAASGQPVPEIMATWILQTGYPVLDTHVNRNGDGTEVSLRQHRFLYDDIFGQDDGDKSLWRVPVGISKSGSDEVTSLLMDAPQEKVSIAGSPDWIKVNALQTGFYRVKYAPDELEKLAEPVRSLTLPAADRLGIQNDAFALTRAGHIPATQFLAIAEAYKNETDASVASDLATNLGSLDNLIGREGFYRSYQAYARGIFKPVADRIGWDAKPGEGHLDALLRSTVLLSLGGAEDEDTLREARARFAKFVENRSSVHPDIRGATFLLTAKHGDRATYNRMWELQKAATLQEEKVRFLISLASFEDTELVQETLNRALTDEVRTHDAVTVIVNSAGTPDARDVTWEFVKENWSELDRRYGDGGFALMRLVSITGGFTSEEKREDVERFFRDHPAPGAERSIRQSLERIHNNVAWLAKNRYELASWFVG